MRCDLLAVGGQLAQPPRHVRLCSPPLPHYITPQRHKRPPPSLASPALSMPGTRSLRQMHTRAAALTHWLRHTRPAVRTQGDLAWCGAELARLARTCAAAPWWPGVLAAVGAELWHESYRRRQMWLQLDVPPSDIDALFEHLAQAVGLGGWATIDAAQLAAYCA